jgi:hypothetical protein
MVTLAGEVVYPTDDAARYLSEHGWRVSSTYLITLRSRRKGPKAIRIGAQVRYKKSDLDAHLTSIFQAA